MNLLIRYLVPDYYLTIRQRMRHNFWRARQKLSLTFFIDRKKSFSPTLPPKAQSYLSHNIISGTAGIISCFNHQDKMDTSKFKEHDVVCEKGRGDHERWPGNKLYRSLINIHKEKYNDLGAVDRSKVIGTIISTISDKNGWFVTTGEGGHMCERVPLAEEKVRKKVSDDLRREVRRLRERRSNKSAFTKKLKAIKKQEDSKLKVDHLKPVDTPKSTDVLFGPGARRHAGNKLYWKFMKLNLDQYIVSPYGARSSISKSIVDGIKDLKGRFLEQDPDSGIWYEISDKRAVEKTSHALSNKKYKTRKQPSGEDEDEDDYGESFDVESGVDEDSKAESTQGETPGFGMRSKKHMLKARIVSVDLTPGLDDEAVGSKENTPQNDDAKKGIMKEESRKDTFSDIKSAMSPKLSRDLALQADPELARHALSLATLASYPVVSSNPRSERYEQLLA
jgi:hypothetical protein